MPLKPPKKCLVVGCGDSAVQGGGYCENHRAQQARERERKRGSAHARGYTRAWQRARRAFLKEHPLCECEDCMAGEKRITPAEVVDHIRPHRGDSTLFWDTSNWQAMGKRCHDRKTARQDGRWSKNQSFTRGRAG